MVNGATPPTPFTYPPPDGILKIMFQLSGTNMCHFSS